MYKDIQKFLGQSWEEFRQKFKESLKSEMPLLDKVNTYVAAHGGKQLRPTFTLLIAKALRGFCDDYVISCAAAAELLHTATLLHDDVADDSPVRRGAPTVRALYSPTSSVLVGDFWLSRAVDLVIDHPDKRVLKVFSKCLNDLAEGEMLQLEKANTLDTTEDDYISIIYRKTASLFEASILSAAYSVKADDRELAACKGYAYHIGLAFQIMDDILDYSPEYASGKPTGQDIREKKITLPLLGLFEAAPKKIGKEIRERMRNADSELAADAIRLVKEYDGCGYALKRLREESEMALRAISCFKDSEARDYLERLAGHMAVRTA